MSAGSGAAGGAIAARVFAVGGIAVLTLMLYGYWFGASGVFAMRGLKETLATQERVNAMHEQRNRVLAGEVVALQRGLGAVEAKARTELGMVRDGETFYLVVDHAEAEGGRP